MQAPINHFKRNLLAGKPQIGLWAALSSAYVTELLASVGYDWLLIDGEHAPNDVRSTLAQLQAVAGYAVQPVVRVVEGQVPLIKQYLDIGAQNLLIPMVESAEQARQMVAATRYPPQGVRGVSVSQRSNRYGDVKDYFKRVNDQISVLVQIESRAGVAAAAQIAAVDNVDCLFVGPSDLAAAYGHLGNPGHPEVQDAIAQVQAAAKAAGKSSGILAPAEADARRYLAQGINFVGVGSDLGVLRMASQALIDKYRANNAAPLAPQY